MAGVLRHSIASALNSLSGSISSGVPLSIIVTRDTVCRVSSSPSTSTTDPSVIQSMGASWSKVSLEDTELHQLDGRTHRQSPSPSSIVHQTILSLIELCKSQGRLCQSLAGTDLFHNLRAAYFLDISGALDMSTINDHIRGESRHQDVNYQNKLNLKTISSLDGDMMLSTNRRSLNASVVTGSLPSQELRSRVSHEDHSRFKIQVLDQCLRCLVCAVQGLADCVAAFPILEQVQPMEWLQKDILQALEAPIAFPVFLYPPRDSVADRSGDSKNDSTSNSSLSSSLVHSTTEIAAGLLENLVSTVNQSTQRCIGR